MNGALLKSKMIERKVRTKQIAKTCEISEGSLYRKIKGDSEFYESEMRAIANVLELTPVEFFRIFFPELMPKRKEEVK